MMEIRFLHGKMLSIGPVLYWNQRRSPGMPGFRASLLPLPGGEGDIGGWQTDEPRKRPDLLLGR